MNLPKRSPLIGDLKNMNNKGAILLTVLVILMFLSTFGMSSIVLILSRTTQSNLELDRIKAMYLAEAAISQSIYEIKRNRDLDNNGVGNVLKDKLGGGTYKASHNFQVSVITGTGEYNGIKRKISIRYSAL